MTVYSKPKLGRPRREMTEEERKNVISVDKGERTFNEVRREFHISCSTLYRWIDEIRQADERRK